MDETKVSTELRRKLLLKVSRLNLNKNVIFYVMYISSEFPCIWMVSDIAISRNAGRCSTRGQIGNFNANSMTGRPDCIALGLE